MGNQLVQFLVTTVRTKEVEEKYSITNFHNYVDYVWAKSELTAKYHNVPSSQTLGIQGGTNSVCQDYNLTN